MAYIDEVLADTPLAYYRLGESSGTTMTDSSGNGRHGTYTVPPTLGVAGLLPGDSNTAANFDAVNDYATVPYGAWMEPTAWTIEAWIKPDAVTGDFQIASRWAGSSGPRPWQFAVSSGKLRLAFASGLTATGLVTLVAGQTYHVVATYDGSGASKAWALYVNGALDRSGASTTTSPPHSANTSLYVGALITTSPANLFDGVIDEVAFYGTALSAARIAAHYQAGIAAPSVGISSTPDRTSPLLNSLAPGAVGNIGRIRLLTALGNDTTSGTEVTVSGYAPLAPAWGGSTPSGYTYNIQDAALANLAPVDIVGWEGWSSDLATRYTYGLIDPVLCVADTASDYITLSGFHADGAGNPEFSNGSRVVFHPNHTPAGLTAGAVYWVRDSDGRRFRVAPSSGGGALALLEDTPSSSPRVVGKVISVPSGGTLRVGQIAVRTSAMDTLPAGYFS